MNRAAELGPQLHPWWPDWRGECVAIVAGGPSVSRADVEMLKDRIHVIAIKTAVDLCPWADVVYGCDAPWWIDRKGLPKFRGPKLVHGIQAKHLSDDMRFVKIEIGSDRMLVDQPLHIGNGGNSAFQALNLAVQFGAKDIVMLGVDCRADPNKLHWYGRNKWLNANNPLQSNFDRWKKGFDAAKYDLDRLGVTVVNTSNKSDLNSFRKAGLADIMAEWGL